MPKPGKMRKPLIKFEIQDSDRIVQCSKGHTSFNLVIKVRLNGAMTSRYAVCIECGEEESID